MLLGSLFAPLEGLSGHLWEPLGCSWALLGLSRNSLGALLGALGALLGRSWAALGRILALLGGLLMLCGHSRAVLRIFLGTPGRFCGDLFTASATQWSILELLHSVSQTLRLSDSHSLKVS